MRGYEIHHGRVVRSGDAPCSVRCGAPRPRRGGRCVLGTHWHGLLENDGFRRALPRPRSPSRPAAPGSAVAPDTSFAAERAAQLDLLGDLVEEHLDTAAAAAM